MEQAFQMDLEEETRTDRRNSIANRYKDQEYLEARLDEGTPLEIEDAMMDDEELREELNSLKQEFREKTNNRNNSDDDGNDDDDKSNKNNSNDYDGNSDGGYVRIVEEIAPPENFSPVISQIYRSSFPRSENFKFLSNLNLKSILILIPEEYPTENLEFAKKNNINLFQIGMSGNKEPFVKVSNEVITRALEVAINPDNHPLLIHCNRGKHRTGCLVGCIRRLQKWSLTMILDEYRRFAAPKARPLDQQFIELYDSEEIEEKAYINGWLPLKW